MRNTMLTPKVVLDGACRCIGACCCLPPSQWPSRGIQSACGDLAKEQGASYRQFDQQDFDCSQRVSSLDAQASPSYEQPISMHLLSQPCVQAGWIEALAPMLTSATALAVNIDRNNCVATSANTPSKSREIACRSGRRDLKRDRKKRSSRSAWSNIEARILRQPHVQQLGWCDSEST
mmetsp:Transcript_121622/g.189958  ORF Transcript_121622/g.189958 Transcript_121622/m.189958 type:complete len:177 (-) Transcript_121622:98-628(-)